jgi:hypothetical protein
MKKHKRVAGCDDRPVKLTVELPAALYRDIIVEAALSYRTLDAARVVGPMLRNHIALNRAFRHANQESALRRKHEAASGPV